MRTNLQDYCVTGGYTELLSQWHPKSNGALTPADLSFGSRKKVWWRCNIGHEWQAAVYTRTGGKAGCPYCANRAATKQTSFAAKFPDLAAQWDRERNGELSPDAVLPGSNKKVWWKCSSGHGWQASVKSRVDGCGCPVCTNRQTVAGVNDLATTHPELAEQWNHRKNGSLKPHMLHAGSGKKVWWRCSHGHEWQASVMARSGSGTGCPVCAGKKVVPGENDLASHFPALARQWNAEKNAPLSPREVTAYSNQSVWWRCELGHEWKAQISRRANSGTGCPYCTGRSVLAGFNDLATVEPKIAAQWHPKLNGELTPEMVTVGSHKKVWWQCESGHVWKTVVFSRAGAQRCGCPVCAGKVKPGSPAKPTGFVGERTSSEMNEFSCL